MIRGFHTPNFVPTLFQTVNCSHRSPWYKTIISQKIAFMFTSTTGVKLLYINVHTCYRRIRIHTFNVHLLPCWYIKYTEMFPAYLIRKFFVPCRLCSRNIGNRCSWRFIVSFVWLAYVLVCKYSSNNAVTYSSFYDLHSNDTTTRHCTSGYSVHVSWNKYTSCSLTMRLCTVDGSTTCLCRYIHYTYYYCLTIPLRIFPSSNNICW